VLREAAGKTQADIATLTQIDQADVSRLERRQEFDDCLVATMRRVVEALGGRLELVAAFGNKRIVVTGVEDAAAAQQGVAAVEARRRSTSRAHRGVSKARRATSGGVGLRR
jgi:transcriptional regulator with XRE-family HTH domain